jgi:hypothetical protein
MVQIVPQAPVRITLTRRRAAIKLESVTRAVYYFERGGTRYEREVSPAEVLRGFRDPRARLRVEVETSQHVVTLEDSSGQRAGYLVYF